MDNCNLKTPPGRQWCEAIPLYNDPPGRSMMSRQMCMRYSFDLYCRHHSLLKGIVEWLDSLDEYK